MTCYHEAIEVTHHIEATVGFCKHQSRDSMVCCIAASISLLFACSLSIPLTFCSLTRYVLLQMLQLGFRVQGGFSRTDLKLDGGVTCDTEPCMNQS